ncbi:MAG: hypothetical protein ABL891_05190 [Burkholderiales bacterium]
MDAVSLKRPLIISALFIVVLIVGVGLFVDVVFATMLCVMAMMWQMLRLLYYAVRWNTRGLKVIGARLLMWAAAAFGLGAMFSHYSDVARVQGGSLVAALQAHRAREGRFPEQIEALAPRDIAVIPMVKMSPIREQKFRYRSNGKTFTLLYVTGFRMGATYDSETAKWEALD